MLLHDQVGLGMRVQMRASAHGELPEPVVPVRLGVVVQGKAIPANEVVSVVSIAKSEAVANEIECKGAKAGIK